MKSNHPSFRKRGSKPFAVGELDLEREELFGAVWDALWEASDAL